MSSQKPHFLKILRQQHRLLYKSCCCIVFIYLLLNIIKIETPPFFLSMMYSVPIQNTDSQEIYEFRYNEDQVWKDHQYWNHHRRITFYYTIDFYAQSLKANPIQAADGKKIKNLLLNYPLAVEYAERVYTSPQSLSGYPQWLQKYMGSIIGVEIYEYVVLKKQLLFDKSQISLLHVDTLIQYSSHEVQ